MFHLKKWGESIMEEHIQRMLWVLDERQKRLFLASEAKVIRYGGISAMSRMSGISRITITRGMTELKNGGEYRGNARQSGGAVTMLKTSILILSRKFALS
jgi:hypothetical protein